MATTIPNLDQYQGDPLIYQEASQPGKMRHTFTGLRTTFPNLGLHYVIAKQVLPLRVLIVQQGAGKQEGPIDVNLMTAIHDGIDNISRTLKTLTFTGAGDLANADLATRRKAQADFIGKSAAAEYTVEKMATDLGASFADALLQPVGINDPTVSFDFKGQDPDYPQPTPGRFPNNDIRMILVGLDLITVYMTTMPSASMRRQINQEDNARLQAQFADLYAATSWGAQRSEPYNPTGTMRSQLDGVFNADGSFDPQLNEGDAQKGEQLRFGANAVAAAPAATVAKPFGT